MRPPGTGPPTASPFKLEHAQTSRAISDTSIILEGRLRHPSRFSIQARVVFHNRKRPCHSSNNELPRAKKLKTFVTKSSGKVIRKGLQQKDLGLTAGRAQTIGPKRLVFLYVELNQNYDKTIASKGLKTCRAKTIASEANISGTILTCVTYTGAEANLVGRKHLYEFDKAKMAYTIARDKFTLTI